MYLVTGAGGQLGRALAEEFAEDGVVGLTRADWDVELPPPDGLEPPDVVLHAAAWTNVDGAEDDPQGAAAVNVGGTANVAALGRPVVYYSTDYVFDGRKPEPYLESDGPNPQSAYGRTKLHGEAAAGERAWIMRSSWLFGPTGTNFVRTMLRLGEERDEVAVVDDQRGSPTYVGHLAAATRQVLLLPYGVYHVAADGDATWADFAEAIFEEAGLSIPAFGGSRPPSSAGRRRGRPTRCFGARRARRELPHWREGPARDDRRHPSRRRRRIGLRGELLVPDDLDPGRAARKRLGRDLRDRAVAGLVAWRRAGRQARARQRRRGRGALPARVAERRSPIRCASRRGSRASSGRS